MSVTKRADSEDSFELVEADSEYDEDADPHAQQGPTFMAQGLKMIEVLTSNGTSGVAAVAQLLLRSSGLQKDDNLGIEAQGQRWYELVSAKCCFKPIALDGDDVDNLVKMPLDGTTNDQIAKDLPRTFGSVAFFKRLDVTEKITRVLQAIAVQLPTLGYVQGMSFLVSFIFMHFEDEPIAEQATYSLFLAMLVNPSYNLAAVFANGLPNLIRYCNILEAIVRKKNAALYKHLEEIGLGGFCFAYEWIITLFTYSMPFSIASELWTNFFSQGWTPIFQAATLLILELEPQLLAGSFEDCFELLRQAPCTVDTGFVERVLQVEVPSEELQAIATATAETAGEIRNALVTSGVLLPS